MIRLLSIKLLSASLLFTIQLLSQNSQNFIGVYTKSYENTRSGANTHENTLTPANVSGLHKLYSLPMEGDARGPEAQPLFVPNLITEDGLSHNAILTFSSNNLVFCFDTDNLVHDESAILWTQKLGTPVNVTTQIDMWKINDHFGILSTPVIDPETSLLYIVSWNSPDGTPNKGEHFLHVLNLRNGTHAKPPIPLSTVSYVTNSTIPVQKWSNGMRKQRSSLLLTNINGHKTVLFGAGSVLETSNGQSGWIIAYDIDSSTLTALATAPKYSGGGVWMAGQGLSEYNGQIFGVTGNGGFDGVTDFSESIFRLSYTPPTGTLQALLKVDDWWSPYSDSGRIGKSPNLPAAYLNLPKLSGTNSSTMTMNTSIPPVNSMGMSGMNGIAVDVKPPKVNKKGVTALNPATFGDQDLGSSGVNLIPELGLAFTAGKDGILYTLNMNNLGKTKLDDFLNPAANYAKLLSPPIWYTFYPGTTPSAAPANVTDLDFLYAGRTHHMHSTSAVVKTTMGYYVYCMGENGNLRAWRVDTVNGKFLKFTYLGCSAEYASAGVTNPPGGMPGGMITISSSGTSNVIVWVTIPFGDANRTVTNGYVAAYDGTNLGKFADGSGSLTLLWKSGTFVFSKFIPPVVNGGKVFVSNYSGGTDVYGLQ